MIIRPMEASDLSGLEEIALCFPPFQRRALKLNGMILVAEDQGKLVGAIKGKVINTKKGSIGGILWLMIHPDHQTLRSRSITSPLMKKLIEVFEKEGTRWQIACVDLANLPSSRGVGHFGFEPAGLSWIWRTFTFSWPKIAYEFWHLVDIGQILWVRGKEKPSLQSWGEWIFLLVLFTLPWWMISGLNPSVLILALGMIFMRDLPQHLLGFFKGSGANFRGFDSALLPSLLMASVGLWFPYFGVWVHQQKDHSRQRSKLATCQFISISIYISLIVGLYFLGPSKWVEASRALLLSIPLYLLSELMLPIFPFKGSIRNRMKRK